MFNNPELSPDSNLTFEVARSPSDRVAYGKRARGYRSDIDGLRAIAIVLVVLSHMGLKALVGGFVGVDIFFVISGYLLTANIAHRIAAQTFSIAGFYEGRIRRILPALVVMLLGTSILAYVLFPSRALVLFAKSLLASILSYSNFYFWSQPDGYFTLTFTKLLLHTWSLGVEEQFYLVLPLCMIGAARFSLNLTRPIISALGYCSFAYAIYLTFQDRTLAFYMPYTRAWEFLIGSALALGMIPPLKSRRFREGAGAFSLLIILSCLLLYTQSMPFPGLAAVPPCLAAAILILIGEQQDTTTVTKCLSWPVAVFIGTISYSLYLWHWPVILFFRLGILPKLDYGPVHGLPILSIILSTLLAFISWKFVEQPFRTGLWKPMPRAQVFLSGAAAAAVFSLLAATFLAYTGLPNRFSANGDRVGNYLFGDSTKRPSCFVETSFATYDAALCLARLPGRASFLLFGDSHADALWFGLSQSLTKANILQATASACAPTRGRYDRSPCGSLRRFVYDDYLLKHKVDYVILSEAWKSVNDLDALEPALEWFRARDVAVIIVGPVSEYSAPLPLLLALSDKWMIPDLAEHRLLTDTSKLDEQLARRLKERSGIAYASAWHAICTAQHCQTYANREQSIPMLFDTNHLTAEGATLVIKRMQADGQVPK